MNRALMQAFQGFKISKQNMITMNKILLILLFLLPGGFTAFAQGEWKLRTEKDGIKIYTSQVPESKVKAVKVECEINATASQLVALVMDVNTSTDWVYHTKSCSLIRQVSPTELYYYSEVSLPWPAANRDFVAHLTVSQNPGTKVVVIDGPAVPGFVPLKNGIVRIKESQGKWTITPIGDDKIKVEYTLHVEPGGDLPSWIVNMFATEGPMQIFKKLRLELQKPPYKNAVFAFIGR
jgi:ribosome-associated toxin RatA of RatAB toxin-antitoxin module